MLDFIDISNWQGGIGLPALLPNVDGVVCKATEGAMIRTIQTINSGISSEQTIRFRSETHNA